MAKDRCDKCGHPRDSYGCCMCNTFRPLPDRVIDDRLLAVLLNEVRVMGEAMHEIKGHLSRLAAAAESPFWSMYRRNDASLEYEKGQWVAFKCSMVEDYTLQRVIVGPGPTPQAAVEAFDRAFRGEAK